MNDTKEALLESYMNGNISWVKSHMKKQGVSLAEMLDFYLENFVPTGAEIHLFVRRLTPD